MVFKFISFLSLVALVRASALPSVYVPIEEHVKTIEEHDPHPQYSFTYGVKDIISGDSKSQTETRDGDLVKGQYSLDDADGYKRTVTYTADSINGFNAVVDRKLIEKAGPAVIRSLTPVATPVISKTVAPVAYASPSFVKSHPISYAAPLTYSAPKILQSVPAPSFTRSVFKPRLGYGSGSVGLDSYSYAYGYPSLARRLVSF